MIRTITPISQAQQQQVIDETLLFITKGANIFNRIIPEIPVLFDLKGKSSGMFRIQNNTKSIRYNPYIFSKYWQDNFHNTIPHEVAHYIVHEIYGRDGIRPHGKQWQTLMRCFDREPKIYTDYDLSGLPTRNHQKFRYTCKCQTHWLGKRRHLNIAQKKRIYFCKKCRSPLVLEHTSE